MSISIYWPVLIIHRLHLPIPYHYIIFELCLLVHTRLKNLPPFLPMPVPVRLAASMDLVSGRHLSSLRLEKRPDKAGLNSSSFMLLHEMTVNRSKSGHDKIIDSRP